MDEDEVCQQPSPEEDNAIDARSRQGSRTPEQSPPYVQRSSSSHASRVSPHGPVKVEPYDGPSDCPNSDLEGHSGEEEEENDDEGSSCSPLAGRTDEPSDESDPLNCVRHSMDASGLSQDTFLNGGSTHSVDSNPDTLGTLMAESASEEGVLNSDRQHPGPVYQCHICGYTGTSKFHFNSHMNTHYDHKCSQCDYTSRTEGRLKRHLRDFHSESAGDGYDRHDSGANGTRTVRVSTQGKVKTYKCKQCSFVATAKTDFWEHSKTHIKAEKLLTCPKCPFVTEYKHHLEYHLRNHFGSKPFKCPKCNYSCVNKSMLNSHMKSHSNIYQYRCSDCAYATKYCHSLKLHLRKYGHKPSTVLNVDGTPSPVPVIDVYGSRRGPRSRKHHDELMSGFNPFTPLQIPMNGGLPSSTGNTPVPQFLYPGTVVNGFHGSIALHHSAGGIGKVYPRNTKDQVDEYAENGRYQAVVAHTHLSQASPPERLRCNLCDFSTDSREAFTKHMLLHAAAENQDLCNLYGISSESLVQEPPPGSGASASHHPPPQMSMHSTHPLLHHSPRPTISVPGTMPRSQPHSPHCPPPPPPPIQLSPHHLQPSIPHSQSCHPTVSLAAELMITPTSTVVQTSGGLTPYHQRPSPTEGPGGGTPSFRKPTALQSETGSPMDQNFRAPIPGGTKFSSPPSTHPLEHLRLFSENIAVRSMFVKELLPHSFPTFPSTLPTVTVPGTGNCGNNCIGTADTPYGPNSSLLQQQQPTVSSAATLTFPSHPCKPMVPQDVPRLQLKPTTGAVGHVPLDLSNTKFPRLGLPLQRRPNSNVQLQELPSVSGGSSSVEATTVVMSPSVSPPLAMSPLSVSRSAPASSPPHKHRRKGKAFKLDRICMKLQEKVTPRDSPDGTECPPSEILHDVAYDDVMEKDQDSNDSTKMDEVVREASTNTGFVVDHLDGAEFTHRDSNGVKRHNRPQVMKSYEFHEEKMVGSKDGSEKINGRSHAVAPPPRNAKVETKVFPPEPDEELRDDEDSHWKEAYECQYCDMAFKDCIMYTVHMGYHGFKDPFKCNMCGQQTKDKVAFFLHIARTAHL